MNRFKTPLWLVGTALFSCAGARASDGAAVHSRATVLPCHDIFCPSAERVACGVGVVD